MKMFWFHAKSINSSGGGERRKHAQKRLIQSMQLGDKQIRIHNYDTLRDETSIESQQVHGLVKVVNVVDGITNPASPQGIAKASPSIWFKFLLLFCHSMSWHFHPFGKTNVEQRNNRKNLQICFALLQAAFVFYVFLC